MLRTTGHSSDPKHLSELHRRDRPSDRNSNQLSSSSYQLLDLSVLFNFIFLSSVWSGLGSSLLIIQFPLLLLSCHLMKSFRIKIQRNDMIRAPSWSSNIPTHSENERNPGTETSTNGSIDLNKNTSDNNMKVKSTYRSSPISVF